MSDTTDRRDDAELEKLLPWYANGTLSDDERREVEAYLERSAEARAELAFLQGLRQQVKEEAIGNSPGELGWRRLQREIKRDGAGAPAAPAVSASPGWWRPAAIAAALVIVLQSAVLVGTWPGSEPQEMIPAGVPSGEAAVLQVTFAPDATEAQISDLLRAVRGNLVGGPSALGIYRVEIGTDPNDAVAVGQIVERLRAEPDIVLSVERQTP